MGANDTATLNKTLLRRELEGRLAESGVRSKRERRPRLRVMDDPDFLPVEVDRDEGITVSLSGSEFAWRSLGLTCQDFALLLTLIGHARWTTLARNPDVVPEHLVYTDEHGFCVFGPFSHAHEFLHALEAPRVCGSCARFFEELGAKREIRALRRLIATFPAPVG